ncbi:MAG: hypothetical protein U0075_18460 [Thermomicrobiales bacterium]
MNQDTFDALARISIIPGSRRATLGALLAAGMLSAVPPRSPVHWVNEQVWQPK